MTAPPVGTGPEGTDPSGPGQAVQATFARFSATHAESARKNAYLEKFAAAGLLLLIGLRQHLGQGTTAGFTIGGLAALALMPVWFPALRRYRGARPLMIVGLFAVIAGQLLNQLAKADHTVGRGLNILDTMLLVDILTGIGVVLWSRRIMSVRWLGFWYGLGMLGSIVASPDSNFPTNPWKFGLAVTVAVIVLSIAERRGLAVGFAALLALALTSILSDSRSYFATFVLAALLLGWQARPRLMSKRASWTWTAAFMVGLSIAVYYLGSTLLVGGYLGKAAQTRSVEQIDAAGSLIVGGRPELAASIALFEHYPTGFGSGVAPTAREILVAKQGMADINYDPNNNYVDTFMFGGGFELHSTIADAWAHFGWFGIAFILYCAFLVLRGLAESISRRTDSALLLFLSCWTLWNVLFSPFLSAAPTLILAVGLALGLQPERRARRNAST